MAVVEVTSRQRHDVIGVAQIKQQGRRRFSVRDIEAGNSFFNIRLVSKILDCCRLQPTTNQDPQSVQTPGQTNNTITMRLSRTPAIRSALPPGFRQVPRLQPGQTRRATTGPGPSPPGVGDKGTAKVYNKDGTNPNKNFV